MYNADTNDIDIGKLIAEAIAGNKDASEDLVASEWMEGVLDKITTRHARKFKIDRNEIRDTVRDKLRENIETIGNPNRLPLTRCLASWLKKASRHLCINKVRHRKVEKNYVDYKIHENTH